MPDMNPRGTSPNAQPIWLSPCTVLGGSGYALPTGTEVNVCLGQSAMTIRTLTDGQTEHVSYPEVVSITISGPGRVTSGSGFIGGGFGVAGAVEGMVVATILNALTTRTKVHTILEIITHRGELFLHYGQMEPGALRIVLSPVFTRRGAGANGWPCPGATHLRTDADSRF